MIDAQTVARIIDAAHIEDVVSDFVTLKRRGVNYIGLCPFHDEKTGSFIVSPAKGIFKCFGCGKAGGPVHFVMEHEQLSYPDALRYLARKYHIEIHEKELTPEELAQQSDRESMFAINQWALNYFSDKMNHTPDGHAIAIAYFRERGFTDETIKKFGLGYCPDTSDGMSLDALKAGYNARFLQESGLGIRHDNGTWYDRFRGRVMFPVHTLSGKVVAFGGRVLKKSDKTAKYVNSPESLIYHKSNELYGIYFAKQTIVKADRCILVEGYTDVISMHQSGVQNVVASSGTSLTSGQIRMIHRFTPNITVIYDGDSAGIKASIRGIDLLLEEGMNVKVVLLPNGEDPDSFAQSHDAAFFIDFIEKNQVDFIQFKINLLMSEVGKDPIKRAELIADVTRSVALIPDNITRSVYIHETATSLAIEERIIANEITKILRTKREKELQQKSRGNYEPYRMSEEKRVTTPAYRNETDGQDKLSSEPTDTANTTPQSEENDTITTTITDTLRHNDNPFVKYEQNILNYLVRYGEEQLVLEGIGEVTVAALIKNALADLTPPFHDDVHQRMYNIAMDGFEGRKALEVYRDYPDPDISALSTQLISEQDELSRMWDKREGKVVDAAQEQQPDVDVSTLQIRCQEDLVSNILTVVHEYKLAIVKHQENELDKAIQEAQNSGDFKQAMTLLKEKVEIKLRETILSDHTGGTVVVGPRKK